ncbi:MAG: DNA repair protein RadA [Candidatus Omnitrophota bacterium]|jgi:DNA repair protein RadA/Sms|nr:DNA repair protein RadA [Candidatus Omnitrophota bacterium]
MKTKTMYVCQECGAQATRWVGKCPSCNQWNTYVEESAAPATSQRGGIVFKDGPVLLADVKATHEKRYLTDIQELDRVLGGGIVRDSVILIAGDPGIGKSTLAMQIALAISQKGSKVLYVSGEESVQQTQLRAQRLNPAGNRSLYIVNQVDLETIVEYIKKMQPQAVIIDSIQVLYSQAVESSPGSVSQVRECAAILTHLAKTMGVCLFIIGHVTKEGMIAGPRVLEHIVDTVLYFEGERYSSYRILRSMKNRFGSTNEIGVFEMNTSGLKEVSNPSEIFLAERPQKATGSVVVPILEGTRPFLVEVQGLVSRSTFGVVRQKAQGFDANRLALLIAVLEKRLDLNIQDKDVFLNVVGGVKVMDPAADLAVVLAIASALLDKAIGYDTVVLGEVGLSSEVRSVSQIALRINEAEKLGFKKCIMPKNNLKMDNNFKTKYIQLIPVETVKEAWQALA